MFPVIKVDSILDSLTPKFKARNAIEAGAYAMYHSNDMHGLPVGVQIVGKRLEEEKVLEGMKIIDKLLRREGREYQLLSV